VPSLAAPVEGTSDVAAVSVSFEMRVEPRSVGYGNSFHGRGSD